MTYSLGVDLGTSFVAAAVARPAGVAMVPLGDQSVVAPAVVSVRPDGSIVAGDAAERRAISQPTLVARSVKRRLGDPDPVRLGDVSYPVATLLSAQLRDVVQKAADREGGPPEQVVLAHPATWTPARRARFEEVARAAGIDAPRLVTAAEAAAHYAARGGTSDGRVVAVYDLGGGGFEATIVRTGPGGPEILGTPEGVEGFGGADIDEAILSYVDDAVGGALARLDSNDARTAVALARLHQDCVLAKENLSLDTETVVPVFLPGRHFEIRLNRTTFEQMLRSPLEATVAALSRTVRSAGLTPADVDAVLLVGGSTRIPVVAQTVAREFGRPMLDGVHPVHVVALGAALLMNAPAPSVTAGWVVPIDAARTAPRTAAGPSDEVAAGTRERAAAHVVRNGAGVGDQQPGGPPSTTADAPWFDTTRGSAPEPPAPPSGPGAHDPLPAVEMPRFDPADAAGWPQPVADGPGGAPAPRSAFVPPPVRPVAPVPAPARRGGGGGTVVMVVGTLLAVLILVLVFVLAP